MASDAATGRVWVTDFSAGRIIEIDFSVSSPSATTIVSSTQGTPNGVWHDAENNRLLYVTWGAGSIRSVDLANGNAISNELSVTGVSNIDGIDENNEGDFYISSWSPQPRITKVTSDFSATETITVVGLNNPADICYALEIDTLAIPSTSGAMVFVGFSSPNSLAERENVYSTSLFPNPTEGNSLLQFQLVEASTISVVVFDVHGKEVVNYGKAHYPAGPNSLFVTADDLAPGQYFIRLNGEESFSLERMIVVD